ncbi:MAG: 30S ribosomal protein S6 [Parasporobacterium sp.]|nr:30S ribosomal protein S6 [Parasporobacterium sp.]
MSKYEIAVVLSAKLEDEERAQIIDKVKALVERYQGTVTDVDDWGKKRLAYEIQKMNEAFYYFVHFESDNADCPNEMEQQLRIMDGVIRYLVVRTDEE